MWKQNTGSIQDKVSRSLFSYCNILQSIMSVSSAQLLLVLHEAGMSLSLGTILHTRKKLGWMFQGSAFYQIIHEPNKAKCPAWLGLRETDHSRDGRF